MDVWNHIFSASVMPLIGVRVISVSFPALLLLVYAALKARLLTRCYLTDGKWQKNLVELNCCIPLLKYNNKSKQTTQTVTTWSLNAPFLVDELDAAGADTGVVQRLVLGPLRTTHPTDVCCTVSTQETYNDILLLPYFRQSTPTSLSVDDQRRASIQIIIKLGYNAKWWKTERCMQALCRMWDTSGMSECVWWTRHIIILTAGQSVILGLPVSPDDQNKRTIISPLITVRIQEYTLFKL